VLAIDWADADHIVSGGADNLLQTHTMNKAAAAGAAAAAPAK
jgi:hypothetical protein